MNSPFTLTIVAPEKTVFEGKVVSAVVPAALGYLGIWAHHAPLAANLISGKIILKKESGEQLVFDNKGKGFVEVLNNEVTIILN